MISLPNIPMLRSPQLAFNVLPLDCRGVGTRLFPISNNEPIDGEEMGEDLADEWIEAFDLALEDGEYPPQYIDADLTSSTNLLPIWEGWGNASTIFSVC